MCMQDIQIIEHLFWAIAAVCAAGAMITSTFGDIFSKDPQVKEEQDYYRHAGPQGNEIKR